MEKMDKRAFWISVLTVFVALLLFATVFQPLINKYGFKVVSDATPTPAPSTHAKA